MATAASHATAGPAIKETNQMLLRHLLLHCLISLCWTSSASRDEFIYGSCSQQRFTEGSPSQSNLNSLLTSVVSSATFLPYNNFSISSFGSPADRLYGLYQCSGDLSAGDCAACIQHCVSQLGTVCFYSSGGAVQLENCYVRYDMLNFLGAPDTGLVFRRCGAAGRHDVVVFAGTALDSLADGDGSYRIASSENVGAVSQCVGDLKPPSCTECVSQAASTLKRICDGSVSGEVYLGKCYARFSAGRYHPNQTNNDDEMGKTTAIIVGVLAAAVLVVMFLAFVRKAFHGGNGKQ